MSLVFLLISFFFCSWYKLVRSMSLWMVLKLVRYVVKILVFGVRGFQNKNKSIMKQNYTPLWLYIIMSYLDHVDQNNRNLGTAFSR
jgi:hypothetical protein